MKKLQTGSTPPGGNRVSSTVPRAAPFGPLRPYVGTTMNEDGAEPPLLSRITEPIVNFGVSVLASSPGALIDPFVLGSRNESDVSGLCRHPPPKKRATSRLTRRDHRRGRGGSPVPAAAALLRLGRLARRSLHEQVAEGGYLLNAWINDLTPPVRARAHDADHGRTAA